MTINYNYARFFVINFTSDPIRCLAFCLKAPVVNNSIWLYDHNIMSIIFWVNFTPVMLYMSMCLLALAAGIAAAPAAAGECSDRPASGGRRRRQGGAGGGVVGATVQACWTLA